MSATLCMNALCKQAAKMSFVSSMTGRQVSISKVTPVRKAVSQVVQVESKTQKLKTCKAAAKRYKVTGTGKVMRRQAMKQHLLGKKSPTRKHRLEGDEPLSKGEYTNVMGQIPHAGVKRPGNQRKAKASQ